MILTELVLDNFGVYRGRTTFDLRPRTKYKSLRPVILFGGKNGAGKTTILEALYLCLYGPLSLGIRTSRTTYKDYLRNRIHRAPSQLIPSTSSSVELEFEHTHLGQRSKYRILRGWKDTGAGIDETLSVTRDGAPIDELTSDHWQEFIKELIPPGLAALCFFDGERIQELAEDSSADEALRTSVLGLLGLDTVDRLRADLKLYISRTKRETGSGKVADELEACRAERETLVDRRNQLHVDVADKESLLGQAVQEQQRREQDLREQGGDFARARVEIQQRIQLLDTKLEEAEKELKLLCQGVLPFACAPKLLSQFNNALSEERAARQRRAANSYIREELDSLAAIMSAKTRPADFPDGEAATTVLDFIAKRLISKLDQKTAPPKHDLSIAEEKRIDGWLGELESFSVTRAKVLSHIIEETVRERGELEQRLAIAPDDDVYDPIHEKLMQVSETVGQRKAELDDLSLQVREIDDSINTLDKRSDRLEATINVGNATAKKLRRAEQTIHALDRFRSELVERRTHELEQSFGAAYRQLSRKEDVIRTIHLDPDSLSISLEDRHGRRIERAELSAGEKQIYAISLLWALANSSGRPLPFVIDTPLGRLDSDHRQRLIEGFFPAASHQVIILSTDTEVDNAFYESLKPTLSHTYHLSFDAQDEKTVVDTGYFWKEETSTEQSDVAQ